MKVKRQRRLEAIARREANLEMYKKGQLTPNVRRHKNNIDRKIKIAQEDIQNAFRKL